MGGPSGGRGLTAPPSRPTGARSRRCRRARPAPGNRRRSLMQMSSASPLIAFVKSGVAGLRPSERRRWEREGTGRNGAGTELDWVKDGNSGSPGRLDSHFVSFVTSRLSSPRGGAVATALCPAPAGPSRGHCPPVTFPWPCRADPSFRRPCAFSSRRDGHAPARWSAGIPHNIPISSSRFLPLPIRKQFVFMFLQITSKFRTPGNKRSFVPSAQSLERAINDAPRPIAPGSGALPARAVRGEARICRAGGDEGLRVCDGTPAERRAGFLPSGRSVGAGIPPFSLSGAGLRARHPKNRWLQNTRGSLARAKPMLEIPQHSWVCALGKNGGLLSTMGTAEGKTPSRRPGAWHSSRGLLRALRPAEPAARGGCRGRGGGSAPPGWRQRRRLRRGRSRHFQEDGATYGKHLEFTGPAGTRREVQRCCAAPSGRGRAAPAASLAEPCSIRGLWSLWSSVPAAPGRMCGSVPDGGEARDGR